MTIPSSPIAQKPAKIGTRYIAVERVPAPHGAYIATTAASHKFTVPSGYDLYPLLDPTDAAELERLRQAKYQAELDMRTTAMSRDVPTAVSPRVWNAWITACDRLSAFEKKIGGGT